MCGICGIVGFSNPEATKRMIQAMPHRGPDDTGLWHKEEVSFGHRRLAVIDLSEKGRQPMPGHSCSFWITYNGEIYNYKSLKEALKKKGYEFKSNTDTEVVLNLYQEYGKGCLNYLRGVFAFAIWDQKKKELFAARDRLGLKPFFYYFKEGIFIFASELKAILASGLVKKDIEPQALADYFRYGSVQAPKTMIKGVCQLMPARYLTLKKNRLSIKKYWQINFSKKAAGKKTEKDYIFQIKAILNKAVSFRLVSDVPLGVFLSGGIDSSIITGLMQKHSSAPVKTFSIGFQEEVYDERNYSRKIAEKFATNHKEILLRAKDIISEIPNIFNSMDQPSIDGFNTFVISKAVRDAGITVALSGLGGDELFAGYPLFRILPKIAEFAKLFGFIPQEIRGKFFSFLSFFSRSKGQLKGLFSLLQCEGLEDLYFLQRSVFLPSRVNAILKSEKAGYSDNFRKKGKKHGLHQINKLSWLELNNYLPNTLLADTDRMSMANSLEVRVPYLDHLLVEKIFEVPGSLKVGSDYPKRLLIKAFRDLVPEEIYKRPKKGFVLPFDKWLKKELKDYCNNKLSKKNTKNIPFIKSDEVFRIWEEFLSGSKKYNYSSVLALLSFINWHEEIF